MAEANTLPVANPLTAGLKPILLLIGIAAAVAAGVTVVLWTRGPSYSLLFANIAAEDQSQIAQALDTAQIPYRIQPGSNNIEVPAERVSEARMKLAGQGLPESGGGFALMDKDPGFGVSQFMENARYQHALETELGRTIANLRPVEAARVHLAIPRQSAFVRDHHPGSASVFVQVKPGRRLEQGQVQAIVNLVASSIPEMEASQVTVVDQQGRLLSSPEGHDEFALREQQFDMVHRLEEDYTQRIEALLAPMIGAGRIRAQVVAQMDMAVSEEAHEQYRPESQIVRSEQISEQSSHDGSASGGVPGALTNQPPPAGVAQAPPSTAPQNNTNANNAANAAAGAAASKAPAGATGLTQPVGGAAGAGADASSSKSTTRNYEIDRTLAYTRQPAGKLKRLTVAVLVDNMRSTDKDGKVKEVALSEKQLEHVTQLVKDAVGFDESRGDNVNVVNASFTTEPTPPEGELESPPFWESPLFLNMAKLGAGLAVLLVLVLSVLRPMVRTLVGPTRPPVQIIPRVAGETVDNEPLQANNNPALPGADPKAVALTHEQQVAAARTLANQDAKRVAQVVRGWVAQDE
ncbi:MAG TPA: flagellar basal-body MS-ring/collar protein FliF [Steroidobacteraceae bacterium]|jgi:flagellar M-ring protein FliF|nr:flagellar basal-body MS-ring/collar protein FliF [Steroidobacteraceae bacterium]